MITRIVLLILIGLFLEGNHMLAQAVATPIQQDNATTLFYPEYGRDFSHAQIDAFGQRGRQRILDWVDYHNLLGDDEVPTEMRASIYEELTALFVNGTLPSFSKDAQVGKASDWPLLELIAISPTERTAERLMLQWRYRLQYTIAGVLKEQTIIAELVIIMRQFGDEERQVQVVQLRWE